MTYLKEHREAAVLHLAMTQEQKLNPLSSEMIAALQARLDAIADDPSIKAVILSGEGKAFCAGHDLREMQAARDAPDGGAAAFADLFARCAALMERIRTLPQPVIAQIHGSATAAGCQLAATCDMVVAAQSARFGVNGVNIGLFCSTPMVALTRAIGQKAAFEMLATGRFIHADEAKSLGLITQIAPDERLADATMELAQTVAGKLGVAVRIGKGAFYAQAERTEADAYRLAGDAMIANMLEPDTDEGLTAFLEKRPPNWAD